jgi:hypothetical protein
LSLTNSVTDPLARSPRDIHALHSILEKLITDNDGHNEVTISFDHDITDGAPPARFTEQLKEMIESSYGLDDFKVESEQAVAAGASHKS